MRRTKKEMEIEGKRGGEEKLRGGWLKRKE